MRRVIVNNNQSRETINKYGKDVSSQCKSFKSPELTLLAGPDNLLLQIKHIFGRLQRNCGWLKLRRGVCPDKDQSEGLESVSLELRRIGDS